MVKPMTADERKRELRRVETAIRKLTKYMHSHTKPVRPGGYDSARLFVHERIEWLKILRSRLSA